jgi:hypothetical protein
VQVARVHGEFVMKTRTTSALARLPASIYALAVAAALFALSIRAPAATFTYTNPSCSSFTVSGTPPAQTVTCVSATAGGVPVCAPTANPAAPAIGTSTTISANCSNQPTGYVWTGGACATVTTATCSPTKSKSATVTYTVTATNASGMGTAAQITVTWK